MFTAALFTIVKSWKQPRCPSTEEWIKKMWGVCVCVYIYWNVTHRKNKIIPFVATWMDLEIIIEDKYHYDTTYKIIQLNLFTKQNRLQKQKYGYQRRNRGRKDKLGVWN